MLPDAVVPKATSALGTYAAGAVGLAGAFFLLKKVGSLLPESVPTAIKNVAPGLVSAGLAFFLSTKIDNKYAKYAFLGMGAGAIIDIGRKVVPAIAGFTPSLSGLGSAHFGYKAYDTGDYPMSYYEQNSFQGLGNTMPYALNGNQAFALNGNNAFALNGLPVNGLPVNGVAPFALN